MRVLAHLKRAFPCIKLDDLDAGEDLVRHLGMEKASQDGRHTLGGRGMGETDKHQRTKKGETDKHQKGGKLERPTNTKKRGKRRDRQISKGGLERDYELQIILIPPSLPPSLPTLILSSLAVMTLLWMLLVRLATKPEIGMEMSMMPSPPTMATPSSR